MNGTRGLRLGRIFGIEIAIDSSWAFIALLMGFSLVNAFSHWHPGWTKQAVVGTAIFATLLFFASVVLHELAHSVVARRFGIPVHRITLFLLGGVSNIEREPPSAKAEFVTAAVGPIASLGLGAALLAVGSIATHLRADLIRDPAVDLSRLNPAESLLLWLGPINLIVGLFNLIPAFPLDGGRILRAAIWGATGNLHAATRSASAAGQAIGWALVFVGVAIAFGASVPFFGHGVVSGIWLAFIGWFMSSAASRTWRRQLVHEVLEGVSVTRLMAPSGTPVPADLDLERLGDAMIHNGERASAIIDESGAFVGLVTFADLSRVSHPTTRAADVMTPRSALVTASPGDDLADAADKMAGADVGQLPVIDGDRHLVGMLRRRDVLRWIELHLPQGAGGYAHR